MLSELHREHRLTEGERSAFERDGFLHVPAALDPARVARLEALVDGVYAEHREAGHDPYLESPFDAHRPFFSPDFLARDPAFVDLLDHPTTFAKVADILGWNIYCYHSHLIVTPPRAEVERAKPLEWRGTGQFGFHQDSGRVNVDMETHPRPRLSVKVVYWLSDCTEPDRANLYVVPGSHREDSLQRPTDGSAPDGAVPVLGAPGDALVFDRRLWHSSSANLSGVTRKALFYGYGYRWLRPKDEMTIPDALMAGSDPIRRQLLGWSPDNNRRFSPREGDVPLRDWLESGNPG